MSHVCEYPPNCPLTAQSCEVANGGQVEIEQRDLVQELADFLNRSQEREKMTKYYRHPQGSTITVYSDGTLEARKPDGKKKKTSATAEKLADGHGAWVEVPSLDPSTALPSPEEIHAQQMAAMPLSAEIDASDPSFHAQVSNSEEHIS